MSNPYYTPRLGNMMPHDLVRFSAANAEMHAPCAAAAAALRRDLNMRPRALNRLRESEQASRCDVTTTHRYEDPSYENVHVHWQNGFEFGRSRDYEHSHQSANGTTRPQLQRARSESPSFSTQQRRMRQNVNGAATNSNNAATAAVNNIPKYGDPFKNYVLNAENNTFKPKLAKVENGEGANGGVPSGNGNGKGAAEVVINALSDNVNGNETPPTIGEQLTGTNQVSELELEMEGAMGGASAEILSCSVAANATDDVGEIPTNLSKPLNFNINENQNENVNMNMNDNETDATKTNATNNSNNNQMNSTNNEQNDD
ncbi:PREDICTED: ring canal kelch protein-like [Rhagoletis zephyria]|uniref:ring canal kelch protein-like n=1 Tax=Rhagoletis zephyria TaxID=28612 RepID=UPI00081123E6|nr:PREDICTED: ring canal kelch protein-like [Rhagoletis zephyria]